MTNYLSINGKTGKLAFLATLTGIVTLLHFTIPTDTHVSHAVHIILRKLYFLPPVIAGAWFGLRGAFYTTFAVTVLFTLHAVIDWPWHYMEQANQLGELVSFWVIGLVPGWLFERQQSLTEKLARSHEETLLALVSALDLRERHTRLHSQRVRDYTLLLAERYHADQAQMRVIALGALLHDVGKIAVPDQILMKPSGLTEEEWKEMRKHPGEGYGLLRRIGFLESAAEIVYSHHEHFDGTGYPRGLRGEEIPLGARLFMVADVFDALTSERPYHKALEYEQAASLIREQSGNHFDPAVVKAFERISSAEWEEVRKRFGENNGDVPDQLY